jgi:hypothetical protein
LLFGSFIFSLTAFSQGSTYLVKAGEHPVKAIPDTAQFQYPEFRKGLLFLPMGEKSPVMLLNYNLLYATIQLINENGDTLALDENANIVEYVRIESDLYYRDSKEGYCLIISKDVPVKLVVRFRLNIVRRERVVNDGYSVNSSGSSSSRSARRPGDNGLFLRNEDVYFRKEYDYFFLVSKNKIFRPFFCKNGRRLSDKSTNKINLFFRLCRPINLILFCHRISRIARLLKYRHS